MRQLLALCLVLITLCAQSHGNGDHEHHGDHMNDNEWVFWPDYTLPGSANNFPGPRPAIPVSNLSRFGEEVSPIALYGETATDFYTRLLHGKALPEGAFSIELLHNNHINRDVGALASFSDGQSPQVLMGFYGDDFFFGETDDHAERISIQVQRARRRHGQWSEGVRAYKKRWHHLVGTFDGAYFTLYHNGEQVGSSKAGLKALRREKNARFEIAGYLKNEPYMDLGNAIRYAKVHYKALDKSQIDALYQQHTGLIEQGILFNDMFHFTAGPYLNAVQPSSINLMWETSTPSNALIEWGLKIPFEHKASIENNGKRKHTYTIAGLRPDTPYFYRITSTDKQGNKIDSGNLTFRSGIEAGQPLSFVVIGDTEARPFVNDQIAKLIWEERPHMVMLVGDLTDGGTQDYRFEWTHEYFQGMTQLTSRIPVIAAPGNGEEDLVWYNYYHALPDKDSFYSYKLGDAEFFMLDSNMGHREREKPGFRKKQRAWLENALKNSTAKWKFAGHHHPTYSSDEDDYGNTMKEQSRLGDMAVRNDFVDLYEKYQVDAVFFGHLHSYERTLPLKNNKAVTDGGVVYVQTGGGGGNHEKATPTRNWFTRKVYSGYHYTLVNQFGDTVNIQVVDSEGRTRDQFVLQKQQDGTARVVSN